MSRSRNAAAARLHESAPVFAALGDETRLQIVARLCAEGPLSITRLSEGAGLRPIGHALIPEPFDDGIVGWKALGRARNRDGDGQDGP